MKKLICYCDLCENEIKIYPTKEFKLLIEEKKDSISEKFLQRIYEIHLCHSCAISFLLKEIEKFSLEEKEKWFKQFKNYQETVAST